MKVHLRKKELKDGTHSLLLDYFLHGERVREYLNIHIKGNNQDAKEKMALARTLAAQKEIELASPSGVAPAHKRRADFLLFFRKFIDDSNRKTKRNLEATLIHLKKFCGVKALYSNSIDRVFCQQFRNHLGRHFNGETPAVYFSIFKQVLSMAVKENIFLRSPAIDVRNQKPGTMLRKEVLSEKEIYKLWQTPIRNDAVRRGFLFACFTGLRMVDVSAVTWKDVDFDNRNLKVRQAKTGVDIFIPLSKTAFSLLGPEGKRTDRIFPLTNHMTVLSNLKRWVQRAGIKKHITFHCARHTYGTLLLVHGNDLKTTSLLLGHTTTRETEKYTHISDKMKRKAVDSIPALV